MFMALVTSLVELFYCCVTADILTKLLQQCFLSFIVVPWLYLGNSQVSVYRTIGPTLVFHLISSASMSARVFKFCIHDELDQVYYCKQNQGAEIYFCLFSIFPFFYLSLQCNEYIFLRNYLT